MEKKIKALKQRIRSRIANLTDSQKLIANFIVENPQKFALSSVRELEQELNVSKSTIVRLAQALGYNGWTNAGCLPPSRSEHLRASSVSILCPRSHTGHRLPAIDFRGIRQQPAGDAVPGR
ncbi:MAG: hypothetical protein Q9P14_05075 [candidate division KSB1 bacterium]|nr:hypothetical protein [candidate division KSB1 bacterium]